MNPNTAAAESLKTAELTMGVGKFWLVFQQNALTGSIELANQYLCRGSSIPNEPSSETGAGQYPLPWPMTWTDAELYGGVFD